jgi:hypothetical protein
MFWIYRRKFQWTQPKELTALLDQREAAAMKWWFRPTAFVAIYVLFGALILGNWYVGSFDPKFHHPDARVNFAFLLLFVLFLVYGIPWITTKISRRIVMHGSYLSICRMEVIQVSYKWLSGYSWTTQDGFTCLLLHRKKGRDILIGVPDQVTASKIDAIFLESGVARKGSQHSASTTTWAVKKI